MAPAIKEKNAMMTWWGSPSSEPYCLIQSGQPDYAAILELKWNEVSGRNQQGGTSAKNNDGGKILHYGDN